MGEQDTALELFLVVESRARTEEGAGSAKG